MSDALGDPDRAVPAAPPAWPAAAGELSVLVVDDGDTSRSILVDQVSSWRMRVAEAATAATAIAVAMDAARDGRPFDVVLVDESLPDMAGDQLAAALADDPAMAGARVVLLLPLGHGRPARGGSAATFLTKPVRQSDLFDVLVGIARGADASPPGSEAQPRAAVAGDPASSRPVLVAEDSPINLQVTLGMLEKLGFAADVAANGREAVMAFERRQYVAVLMDCQMPVMDGYAAAAEIRRREPAEARTPIIAVTAHALSGDRERCLAAGMDDYIAKPVRLDTLAQTLRRWIVPPGAYAGGQVTGALGPPAVGPAALDEAAIERLRALGADADGALVDQIVELFGDQAREHVHELRQAAGGGDAERLWRAAHTLKGEAGALGAVRAHDICAELVQIGRGGTLAGVDALIDQLEAAVQSACAGLTTLVTRGAA